jgi:hypothetical protein
MLINNSRIVTDELNLNVRLSLVCSLGAVHVDTSLFQIFGILA